MDAEDILYILYTSGSTGSPKGVVHTTGGYLTGVYATTKWVFDIKEDDVYWCAADIGWVTGHSYILYGPLANGTTSVVFEGTPAYPEPDRLWVEIEKHNVNTLYTSPTTIRALLKQGREWPDRHDLSSLKLLGTVGEPINPRAWEWYHENIGGGRCPIVDTWWQTETGMILITPLPGVTTTKPGSATRPFPTIKPDIYDEDGNPVEDIGEGTENAYLVLKRPWPAMFRTLYKDPQRYKESYWEVYDGVYFVGDGARRDEDGYYWITGRVDDVMNVSGHRISTIEVENALVSHEAVAESAVIGRHEEDKGQAIFAYVSLEGDREGSDELKSDLRQHVRRRIDPSPHRTRWSSPTTSRRRGAARSCAASCEPLPKAATTWATPRPWLTQAPWTLCRRRLRNSAKGTFDPAGAESSRRFFVAIEGLPDGTCGDRFLAKRPRSTPPPPPPGCQPRSSGDDEREGGAHQQHPGDDLEGRVVAGGIDDAGDQDQPRHAHEAPGSQPVSPATRPPLSSPRRLSARLFPIVGLSR